MLRIALIVSAALHGGLGMWVEVRGKAQPAHVRDVADSWLGPGIEVDAVPLEPPAEPAAEAAAAPASDDRSTPTVREREATSSASAPARAHVAKAPARAETPGGEHAPSADRPVASRPALRATPTESAPAGSAAAENAAPTSAAAFGAAGLPSGVRHLPKAFTRALGIASRGDPRWLALPPGLAGEARIELAVDEDGRLGELTFADHDARAALAPVVLHLLENTALLLANGRFSLDPSKLDAGVQKLRVRVEVTERPRASDPEGDPNELRELEYEPPSPGKPGRGSFALNSGRRVIGWVYLE